MIISRSIHVAVNEFRVQGFAYFLLDFTPFSLVRRNSLDVPNTISLALIFGAPLSSYAEACIFTLYFF